MVELSAFEIARTETTVEQYVTYLKFTEKEIPARLGESNTPMVDLRWEEARAFCLHHKLDLPTEAQWEYATRAGTTTPYSFSGDEAELSRYAWYDEGVDAKVHPVAQKEPNHLSLYDMHGNAWEWVLDRWADRYSPPADGQAARDPTGPAQGDWRVLRGGAIWTQARWVRSAVRVWDWGGNLYLGVGFRCAGGPRRQH